MNINETKDVVTEFCSSKFDSDKIISKLLSWFLPLWLILKTENGQFLTVLHHIVLQDMKKILKEALFKEQIFWISSAILRNFITVIKIIVSW